MKRQILVKVWQGSISPEQALKELTRAGPKFDSDKEKRILGLLSALKKRKIITVNEVLEEMEVMKR